jgi:hypothetical protein
MSAARIRIQPKTKETSAAGAQSSHRGARTSRALSSASRLTFFAVASCSRCFLRFPSWSLQLLENSLQDFDHVASSSKSRRSSSSAMQLRAPYCVKQGFQIMCEVAQGVQMQEAGTALQRVKGAKD